MGEVTYFYRKLTTGLCYGCQKAALDVLDKHIKPGFTFEDYLIFLRIVFSKSKVFIFIYNTLKLGITLVYAGFEFSVGTYG